MKCPTLEPLRGTSFGLVFDFSSTFWIVARLLGLRGVFPQIQKSEGVGDTTSNKQRCPILELLFIYISPPIPRIALDANFWTIRTLFIAMNTSCLEKCAFCTRTRSFQLSIVSGFRRILVH